MSLLRTLNKLMPFVALALLVVSPASAQNPDKQVSVPDTDINEAPLLVFKSIERAWQAGNAQALANLATESRVFVEIRGIESRGGYFTKPQVFYLFKDMFASTSQANFTFVRYHNIEKEDAKIYGMALRSYKSNQSGGLYKDKVFVTLVREGSRWAVAEIKSTW
ncbi:MAG: hypothetical protein ABR899_04530 [Candidatus Krumholzibacteriaceae bacterium]|jgi:hypothetical protein